MEPREQRGLVIAATAQITSKNGLWAVPSQSKPNKRYYVNPFDWSCTCPDYADGHKCKHIHAAQFAMKRDMNPDKSILDSELLKFTEDKKKYPQDWIAYNLAQTTEKHRFQVLLHDLCRYLVNPPPVNRRDPPLCDMGVGGRRHPPLPLGHEHPRPSCSGRSHWTGHCELL